MTPLEYLIPRMDVPVTIGRRVRSVVAESWEEEVAEEEARGAPPEERLRDMMAWIRRRRKKELDDGIVENFVSRGEGNEVLLSLSCGLSRS